MASEPKQKSSLTLAEVVVTLLVIAALIALAYPKLQETRERANRALCMNNLKQLGLATHLYATDFKGYMPFAAGADDSNDHFLLLHPKYCASPSEVYVCPSDARCRTPAKSMSKADFDAPNVCSYAYVAGLKDDLNSDSPLAGDAIADPSKANVYGVLQYQKRVSCATKGSNHPTADGYLGGNALYVDGHVGWQHVGYLDIQWRDADGGTKNIKNPNGL